MSRKSIDAEESYLGSLVRKRAGRRHADERRRAKPKPQKKHTTKPNNAKAINLRYTHMVEAVDAWESNFSDFMGWSDDEWGWDEPDWNDRYSDWDDYDDRWDNRGEEEPTYHRQTDVKNVRDCVICCEEMVDEHTELYEPVEVEFGYSFLDAILRPRERVLRDLSRMPARAKIGNELGCCVPCITRSISMSLDTDRNGGQIRCPRGCGMFSVAECETFLRALPSTTPDLMPLLVKFDAVVARRVVLEGEKGASFVPCANGDCANEFLFLWPKSTCSLVTCNECNFDNCVVCRGPYHWGQTCQQMLAKSPSLAWRHENTRACPACYVSIEKNGGCSHHGCTRCGLQYNWETAPQGIFGIEQMTHAIKVHPKHADNQRHRGRTVSQGALEVGVTYVACAKRVKPTDPAKQPIWMRTIQI